MKQHALILLVIAATAAATVEAKMYRWTDENGVTVYSQSPPESGQAKEIKPPPPPPKTAAQPNPAPASQSGGLQPGEGDVNQPDSETDAQPSKEEIAQSEKIKRENCEAVTHNLKLYTNLGRRVVKTSDGLYKRPSEEERQAEIDKYRELQKEYCSN